jgi:phosphonoacetate hydrolase
MPDPASARRVVVAVFDGLRADLVTPELTPNILRLAARGTWFRQARSVFPSVTRVATTSIATGGAPAVHGIMGNAFYHPAAFRDRVLDTSKASDLRAAEAAHAGRFVAAATFGDQLALAGRSLAVVHTGSAGSAHVINPRALANGHWTFSVHGVAHTQTPDAVTEVVATFGPLPGRELPRFGDIEYAARVTVEHVLPLRRPDVALVWFNEPDTTFHYRTIGHPDSRAVLQAADAAFGRILDWVDAQPDADRIAVIAASDHGHVATSGVVPLADEARAAGFAVFEKEVPEGAGIVMTGGRHGEVRLLDPAPGDLERIAAWLMERAEISHLFSRGRPNGVEGVVPGTLAFDLVENDHERQPDLSFVLKAEDAIDADGLPGMGLMTPGDVPLGGGMHGGLHPGELNTVLVLSAPGLVEPGAVTARVAGLQDIGPTILDLVGVPKAATMRGTSLAREERDEPSTLHYAASAGGFSQEIHLAEQDGRRVIVRG